MLNSEGGIIIWGAPISSNNYGKLKRKMFVGNLSPVSVKVEKDSFIRKVTDSITTSPRGIQFQPLQKSENENVYIIGVEKSSYSPHQFNHRYYMRIDGHTIPAPHHYVEALMKRITYPRLEGYIKIDKIIIQSDFVDNNRKKFILDFSTFIYNKSKLQNEYDLNLRILIDEGKFIGSESFVGRDKYYASAQELVYAPAKNILFYGEPFYHNESTRYTS